MSVLIPSGMGYSTPNRLYEFLAITRVFCSYRSSLDKNLNTENLKKKLLENVHRGFNGF